MDFGNKLKLTIDLKGYITNIVSNKNEPVNSYQDIPFSDKTYGFNKPRHRSFSQNSSNNNSQVLTLNSSSKKLNILNVIHLQFHNMLGSPRIKEIIESHK